MAYGEYILVAAALLAAGIGASLLARRVRLPGLLLFLAVGMVVGSDGLGLIEFDDYELARAIGVVALALILFEGGLSAGFQEIRPVWRASLSLALVGTLITAVVVGFAASWLFDIGLREGMLLGAIVSATDSAAIFSVLRGSTLRRRMARTLEGESGLNDPVAVLLVLGFIEWIKQPDDYGVIDMVGLFVQQLGIGGLVGAGVGWLAVQSLRRATLDTAGLYPVASLATAGLAFGIAEVAHGSGFLAAYLAGLFVGSASIPAKRTLTAFHEGLAWVAQIAMFLALGLLVFPSQLGDVWVEGIAVTLVLVFIARPVATFVATAFESFGTRERLILGWAGLRGAVPVVLATFPVIEGIPNSLEFFNVVFFAVVISTLVQGTTFQPLAERLGLTTNEPALPRPLAESGVIRRLGAEVVEFPVWEDDALVGRRVRELGLPRDALLIVIVRGEEAIPPRGSTRIEAGDRLHVMVRHEVAASVRDLSDRWRRGPFQAPSTRRPVLRATSVIFTARPWLESDGEPGYPTELLGLIVTEQIRTRRDRHGALVLLEDGRYAVTGPVLAAGSASQLQRYARSQLRRSEGDAAYAWWQEVIGALAR